MTPDRLRQIARQEGPQHRRPTSTSIVERDGGMTVVTYHYTDVVRLHPDDTYELTCGGWVTPTTMRRLNTYGPQYVHSSIKGDMWKVHVYDLLSDVPTETLIDRDMTLSVGPEHFTIYRKATA